MVSVDQNRELLVRSNDQEQFRYVLPANMTYHHVIPRNKLAAFWNSVQSNGELAYLTTAIDSLFQQAISRIADTPDLKQHSTVLQIEREEETRDMNRDELMEIMEKMGKGNQLTAAEVEGANIIEKIYQWWPANIHHGPTDRPTYVEPEEDDGGDHFEVSAKHVLPTDQYNKLKKLNRLMDTYSQQRGKPRINTLKNIKGLIIQLSTITRIQAFDPKKWYQVPSGTYQGQWRIRSR